MAERSPGTPVGSAQVGSALVEQFPQDRAVAARFLFAVAAHGEVGLLRQSGQQVQVATRLWRLHLSEEPSPEGPPGPFVLEWVRLQQGFAWREIGKPDVVDVPAGILGLGNAPRRTADGPDAKALRLQARTPQSDDADGHVK